MQLICFADLDSATLAKPIHLLDPAPCSRLLPPRSKYQAIDYKLLAPGSCLTTHRSYFQLSGFCSSFFVRRTPFFTPFAARSIAEGPANFTTREQQQQQNWEA